MFFSVHEQKAENFGSPLFILCQWDDLESHSEDAFLVVVADDFEGTHFGSVLYVLADAEAFIIVTYMNHTDCVGGSFGQTFHVETSHSFLLGDELHGHRQVLAEGFVHYLFYFLDLCFAGTFRQGEVKLTFLAFDVGRYGSSASEEVCHGSVDHVLTGMTGFVLILIMSVQYGLIVFHMDIMCKGLLMKLLHDGRN